MGFALGACCLDTAQVEVEGGLRDTAHGVATRRSFGSRAAARLPQPWRQPDHEPRRRRLAEAHLSQRVAKSIYNARMPWHGEGNVIVGSGVGLGWGGAGVCQSRAEKFRGFHPILAGAL